ncbi:MAG: L-2-hydroxyglutarate oxidase, partial [Chloroflexi bacterium]|nr:L-2-hydroxyglutarate oxidase [Chloroflexota bacterium]
TGHNSGVIHAGLYYPPGSYKAQWCTTGAKFLIDYCKNYDIPYELSGKLVIASDSSEEKTLNDLYDRGVSNGVQGLRKLNKDQLTEIEPNVVGNSAIYSPNTGIVDYTKISESFASNIIQGNAEILTGCQVMDIVSKNEGVFLQTTKGDIESKTIINCAGLQADDIAKKMDVEIDVRIIPFRGEYYTVKPRDSLFIRGLIYPVPDPRFPFLGVHFTKRIDGSIEAGPNAVLAFAREGYKKTDFDIKEILGLLRFSGFWYMSFKYWKMGLDEQMRSISKKLFVKSLQKLVPGINEADLISGGSGVRAQAVDKKGGIIQDFKIIQSPSAVHVLNAPSPAATSSLSISQHIVDVAKKQFGWV